MFRNRTRRFVQGRLAPTLALALLAVLAALPAAAQSTTGSLTGTVTDADGSALPGVTISIQSQQLIGGTRTTQTDERGRFHYELLPPGTYEVSATLQGFDPVGVEQRVSVGQESQVRIQLDLEAFGGEIVVVAEAPVIDATQVGTGEVYNQEYLENAAIGTAGRDYLSVIGQAAGSVGTGNVNVFGSVGSDNVFLIDGINTTDPLTATFGTNFNFDAIQEVSIQTGGFEAEYGQALGGVINVVTKSGGNDFAGSIDARYRDSSFSEEGEHFDPEVNDSTFEQYSGTLGGPLVRDRAWFFLSGENIVTELQPEASPTTRVFDGTNYLAKGTVQLGDANRLVLKVSGDPTDVENADASLFVLPEAATFQEQGGQIYQAEWNSALSDSLFLVLQAGVNRQELNGYPMSGDLERPGFTNDDTGVHFGNATNAQFSERDRDEARGSLTWFVDQLAGSHEIKIGAEVNRLDVSANNFTTGGFEVVYFNPIVDSNGDGLDAFLLLRDFPPGSGREFVDSEGNVDSLFLQDTWQPTDRLTIKPGVRWDRAEYVNDVGTTVADFDEIQPRLGVAYDVSGTGRTVARGYWGRFMHPGSANFADAVSGRTVGFERLVGLDFWCDVEGICDAETLTAIFGAPTDYQGDLFFPFDAITSPFESTETLGIGEFEAQHADQWSLGVEHQLAPDTSVELQYVRKETTDLYEDVCNNALFAFDGIPGVGDESQYTDPSGCTGFVLGNVAGLFRDYEAVILKGESRFGSRLHLIGSYTWAESTGNSESEANQSYASAGYDSFPRDYVNYTGRLADDREHRVKLNGYTRLPWDTVLGFDATWLSGQALDVIADCGALLGADAGELSAIGVDPGVVAFCGNETSGDMFLEPRGSRRGDDLMQLDVQLTKGFQLGRYRLEAVGSVFNLLDSEDPIQYQEEALTTVPLGSVLDHQNPRSYEVGFRLEF
jgi:hypothetical protein